MMSRFQLIGLMSGTSLDGIDLCYASYMKTNESWDFDIIRSYTCDYPRKLKEKLSLCVNLDGLQLKQLDLELGQFFATKIIEFIDSQDLKKKEIDAIASHGHTVFHQPDEGLTMQIGCGITISHLTGLNVINDFRQLDISNGGQGAPLVPKGDVELFRQYDALINIGGFANITIRTPIGVKAFDIGPGNLPLNLLSQKLDKEYDSGGEIAKSGEIIPNLLSSLNSLDYYNLAPPKSLGIEWLNDHLYPKIKTKNATNDLMRTMVEHIATQISLILNKYKVIDVLCTGGGAKNDFLISRISDLSNSKIEIPPDQLIDFKEALIFGFLGALKLNGETNTLSEATGAKQDVIAGVLHIA